MKTNNRFETMKSRTLFNIRPTENRVRLTHAFAHAGGQRPFRAIAHCRCVWALLTLLSLFGVPQCFPQTDAFLFRFPELPSFLRPTEVAVAPDGFVWVVDSVHHQIVKLDPNDPSSEMRIGSFGSGQGEFNFPYGVAVDAAGSIYVTDQRNHRVQKFASDGTFLLEWGSLGSGDGQFGGNAFNGHSGIAVDASGNVYVADGFNNHRVQKFTSTGGFLTKWGSLGGPGQFNSPVGVAVDASGDVYVADRSNHRIQKFTSTGVFLMQSGTLGNGPGQFNSPSGVAVDPSGDAYVADTTNNRIQKFDSSGGFLTEWGFRGRADGNFGGLRSVAVDASGNVLVSDFGNDRVQKFTGSGVFLGKWGAAGGGNGQFMRPTDIAVDVAGNILVADSIEIFLPDGTNDRIQMFDSAGGFLAKWGGPGTGPGEFGVDPAFFVSDAGLIRQGGPFGIAVDVSGDVYVTDEFNHRIQKFSNSGLFLTQWGSFGTGDGQFNRPQGIDVDASGNVFITDRGNNRVQKFSSTGVFMTKWGSLGTGVGQFNAPVGIAVDASGNVYVSDCLNHRIQKFTDTGIFLTQWGSVGAGVGQFSFPRGIAVDAAGHVYVADQSNHRIEKFTSTGAFLCQWGSPDGHAGGQPGQLSFPNGVDVDASGNVYVADTANSRIQVFGNTAAGDDVLVQPVDPETGLTPVTVTFDTVSQPGSTTLTTSQTGPSPPSGFRLGSPPTYYDISTTAQFSDSIMVCIDYTGTSFPNESRLKLFHHENGAWVNVTTSLDAINNVICGTVTSLSPFAVLEEENAAPVITNITGPVDPLVVSATATVQVGFMDIDTGDSHTATFFWDDGTSTGPVPASDGSAVASHQYMKPGVYRVEIIVTDAEGESAVGHFEYVVIYDPNGGFVTGGGWIDSPPGAYAVNPALAGKANFGFVAKYKQGATVPEGNTEFQFKAGNLNFHSTSYDWLVVAGAKAKYKGTGEINGSGNYGFMLTATDGQINGGGVDRFRLKIWDKNNNDVVVYDNQMGASDTADPITSLERGSIVIHKP